ncbi:MULTISPECIES: hypothetical protein [unclassified Acidisoma]|jgi:hypothetical protein|uniref:hypothetical protein n=1 Tax=unclassified Acidisoma TaxID=2634065 RepID=UPI00131ADF65|nr:MULTISPECIES: hypothetical protein [unclassified Acidisoma]
MKSDLRRLGAEMVRGAHGIALLTIGKQRGIAFFGSDEDATRRSFITAVIALPLFVLLRLLDWIAGVAPAETSHALAIDLLSYVIGWTGFVLLSRPILRQMGQERKWPRYITAWNWCNLAQYVLLLVAGLPTLFHVQPIVAETAALVGFGWALWLEWYVARLALEATPLAAAFLVVVDVGLTVALGLLATLPSQGLSIG